MLRSILEDRPKQYLIQISNDRDSVLAKLQKISLLKIINTDENVISVFTYPKIILALKKRHSDLDIEEDTVHNQAVENGWKLFEQEAADSGLSVYPPIGEMGAEHCAAEWQKAFEHCQTLLTEARERLQSSVLSNSYGPRDLPNWEDVDPVHLDAIRDT